MYATAIEAPETYYHATMRPLPDGKRLYLDGVDVSDRATECDTAAGWVMLYETDGNGVLAMDSKRNPISREHRGIVEVR